MQIGQAQTPLMEEALHFIYSSTAGKAGFEYVTIVTGNGD
jgi:hypothetical protein